MIAVMAQPVRPDRRIESDDHRAEVLGHRPEFMHGTLLRIPRKRDQSHSYGNHANPRSS